MIIQNDKPDTNSAVVDRILITTKSLGNTCTLHESLLRRGTKHVIVYNGDSYETYVFTKLVPASGKDLDHLFADWRKKLEERENIQFQLAVNYQVTLQTVIPNTWNLTHKRYAIPLVYEDLYKGEAHILDLAKHNRVPLYQPELDQLHDADLEEGRADPSHR